MTAIGIDWIVASVRHKAQGWPSQAALARDRTHQTKEVQLAILLHRKEKGKPKAGRTQAEEENDIRKRRNAKD